jgi:cytochrome b6
MMPIPSWLEERLPLTPVREFLGKKEVPLFHGTVWYYMGGISLFLFAVQVITGILLLLYYQPGEATAYESVQFIVGQVQFGWLVRELHSWSANLFILFVFLHMFTVFFTRAYRKPRELTWMSGMVLLVLGLAFGFSGYLLPWNELSYFATRVGSDVAGSVPLVGHFLLRLLRAGDDVSGATLTRFYGIHAAVLPAIFTLVLALHLALIQIQGMSVPAEFEKLPDSRRRGMKFFPNFLLRDVMLWLLVLNVLAMLAVFFPWELGQKADPLVPAPAGIKPEWYFMFMFQSLKLLPAHVLFIEGERLGTLLFGIGAVIWFCVPFLDRRTLTGERPRVLLWFGILLTLFMAVMTAWGYLA